eukprot:SAG22_NODE_301_length_12744_cov_19.648189_20_plen_270_part_01
MADIAKRVVEQVRTKALPLPCVSTVCLSQRLSLRFCTTHSAARSRSSRRKGRSCRGGSNSHRPRPEERRPPPAGTSCSVGWSCVGSTGCGSCGTGRWTRRSRPASKVTYCHASHAVSLSRTLCNLAQQPPPCVMSADCYQHSTVRTIAGVVIAATDNNAKSSSSSSGGKGLHPPAGVGGGGGSSGGGGGGGDGESGGDTAGAQQPKGLVFFRDFDPAAGAWLVETADSATLSTECSCELHVHICLTCICCLCSQVPVRGASGRDGRARAR